MKHLINKLINNNIELIEEGVLYAFILTNGNKITVRANEGGIIAAWKGEEDIRKVDCKWVKD